jgi:hypothetical protein
VIFVRYRKAMRDNPRSEMLVDSNTWRAAEQKETGNQDQRDRNELFEGCRIYHSAQSDANPNSGD